jgi:hypothetical protein
VAVKGSLQILPANLVSAEDAAISRTISIPRRVLSPAYIRVAGC